MPRRAFSIVPSVFAAAMLLSACAPPVPVPAPMPASVPSLRGAREVEIVDHWTGFAPQTPVDVRYRLQRLGATGTFAGSGTMAVGSRQSDATLSSGPLAITVPDTAMAAFLDALSRVPIATGEYVPTRERTDSYPELTIRVHLDGGVVEFYSASQGSDMRPWRVEVAGTRYASRSGDAMHALERILPFLRRGELQHELKAP